MGCAILLGNKNMNKSTESVPSKPDLDAGRPRTVQDYKDHFIPFGEGTFQLRILLITAVVCLFHVNVLRLSLRGMDHWCLRPATFAGLSMAAWKDIPQGADGSLCTVRDPPDGGPSAHVVPCTSWEFNLTEYGATIISEWSLVCRRRWMADIAHIFLFVPATLSRPFFGAVADRVGRGTVVTMSLTGLLLIKVPR